MQNVQAIATRDEDATALPMAPSNGPITPAEMLNSAIAKGASIEVIEKLMAMHERMEAAAARKAFDAAMSDAKSEIPTIFKNRTVDFTSNKGRTNYRHEDLGEISRTVDPILAKHGLSYRFRTDQREGGAVVVTCVLSHRDGHSEEISLTAGRDESGNKNNIQAVGSAITYLQRYTLKAALGLAASADDDSRSASQPEDTTPITAEQLAEIEALISELGTDDADRDRRRDVFCKYYQIDEVAALPGSKFPAAKKALEAKRAKA